MKHFAGIFLSFAAVFALVSCSSCSPDREDAPPRRNRSNRPEVFRKLTDYSLELSVISPRRTFPPESDVKLTFTLKNTGLKPVTIKEWRMNESSNLIVRFIPGKPEETAAVPLRRWKVSQTFDPKDKYVGLHNPLILNPADNHALIEVPLTFVKHVKHTGKRQHFTIVAELNLSSVTLKSAPVEIVVK